MAAITFSSVSAFIGIVFFPLLLYDNILMGTCIAFSHSITQIPICTVTMCDGHIKRNKKKFSELFMRVKLKGCRKNVVDWGKAQLCPSG